ncbi:MAG: glycerate kinase [Bacteroidota bacterium]|nr:glycerate kinase [Bacteroidota bacterium]
MRYILLPDKFKGSLTSEEVINALKKGILSFDSKAEFQSYIISDGGEGFLESLESIIYFKRIEINSKDSRNNPINSYYLIDEKSKKAYIELAKSSGLMNLSQNNRNPLYTSTYGTGIEINDALDKGVKEIFIGIGGSSTNDLGLGIFAALGVTFLDKNNNEIMPNGSNLGEIEKLIILDSIRNKIKKVKWSIVNDVENILFGEEGAAYTYAKQKGANKDEIEKLESGGNSVHQVLSEFFKKDYSKIKGAGAAGGCGYGLKLLTEGKFINGIDILFEIININKVLDGGANYIITGEGQIDHQTLNGKVVYSLTQRLKAFNIPILLICGKNLLKKNQWESLGVENVIALAEKGHSDTYCMENAKELVEEEINEYLKAKNI